MSFRSCGVSVSAYQWYQDRPVRLASMVKRESLTGAVFPLLESRNSSFVTYLGSSMVMLLFYTYLLILYIATNV